MKLLVFMCVIGVAFSAPSPQADYPDSSEVELVEPVSTGDSEQDSDGGVYIVLRPSSILNRFPGLGGGFPGFGSGLFPGGSSNTNFGSGFGSGFNLRDLLTGGILGDEESDSEEPETPESLCGPICQMFNLFEDQISVLQSEIDHLGNRTVPHASFDGDFDVNNSTHEVKVLEDGTRIHTNRTVIADKDDNGNRFFFHSVIHQAAASPSSEESTADSGDQSADVSPVLDTSSIIGDDLDPELNEIDEETIVSDEGIDAGLTK